METYRGKTIVLKNMDDNLNSFDGMEYTPMDVQSAGDISTTLSQNVDGTNSTTNIDNENVGNVMVAREPMKKLMKPVYLLDLVEMLAEMMSVQPQTTQDTTGKVTDTHTTKAANLATMRFLQQHPNSEKVSSASQQSGRSINNVLVVDDNPV